MSHTKKIAASWLIMLGCLGTSAFAQTSHQAADALTPFAEKGTGAVTIGHLATVCASDGNNSNKKDMRPVTYFCCLDERSGDVQWMLATSMKRPGFVHNTLACPPNARDATWQSQDQVCQTPPAFYQDGENKHDLACTHPVRLLGWVDKDAYGKQSQTIETQESELTAP
ncbi:MAG: hypothetical protein V4496_06420 [Pseudomonadota bacterium]